MTVQQLIDLLGNHPPDMRVVVNGYEGGYDDLSPRQIAQIKIALNAGSSEWEGKHEEPDFLTGAAADCADVVDAVVLRRESY